MHVLFLPKRSILLEGTKIEVQKMEKGMVHVICGPGKGKSASAVGYGIMGALENKKVILVRYLKGVLEESNVEAFKRMEPEIRVFSFARYHEFFENLSEEQKQEESINLKNGFNFAKKVMVTGECDLLILDEILGLMDCGVVTKEDFVQFLKHKDPEMSLVLTGYVCPEEIKPYVDCISYVENIKVDNSRE